jgi:hypothetical protein
LSGRSGRSSGENDGSDKGGALVGRIVPVIKCQDQQNDSCRGNEDAQPNADPVASSSRAALGMKDWLVTG